MAKPKTAKHESKSDAFKEMLSAQVGGKPSDWQRTNKKEVIWNDVDRTFKNKKTGQEVVVCERTDGLIYTIADDEYNGFTARLPFNAAAKPATVDVVMNMILASRPEIDDDLYAEAVKGGLAGRFSFSLTTMDDGMDEPDSVQVVATIYPNTRDETFRTAAYIRPLVPKADSIDECMCDYFVFDKDLNTPGKIVNYLRGQGLNWDEEGQKREKDLYAEIQKELGEVKAAPAAKGPKR
jgi:hypothetical protein